MEYESMSAAKPASFIKKWATTDNIVVNAMWFQLIWFVAVVGQDAYLPVTFALLAIHFISVGQLKKELMAVLPLAMVGIFMDVILTAVGVFNFQTPFVFPVWLCCLWFAFIATLSRSLSFLRKSIWFPLVLGGVSGSFSYWMGSNFGAVSFGMDELTSVLIIAGLWAFLLPCLVYADNKLRKRLESYE